jgi:hypothetical protein
VGPSRCEVEVTLRLTVSQSASQSVCLGIEHPCGTCDQILFPVGMLLSEICGLVSMGRIACCIVAWVTTYPQSCSLPTAVVLSPVYTAVSGSSFHDIQSSSFCYCTKRSLGFALIAMLTENTYKLGLFLTLAPDQHGRRLSWAKTEGTQHCEADSRFQS